MSQSNEIGLLEAAGHKWISEVIDIAIPNIRRISSRSAITKVAKDLGFELPPAYLEIACEIQGFYPERCHFNIWNGVDPDRLDDDDMGEATEMVLRTFLVIAGSEAGEEFGATLDADDNVGNGVETFSFYRGQLPDDRRDLFPIASDYRSNIVCLDFGGGRGISPSVVYYDRSFAPEEAVFLVAPSFETFTDTLMEDPNKD